MQPPRQRPHQKNLRKVAKVLFEKLDKNGDGQVCIVEFKGKRRKWEDIKTAEETLTNG
jgi:hypothetical protein